MPHDHPAAARLTYSQRLTGRAVLHKVRQSVLVRRQNGHKWHKRAPGDIKYDRAPRDALSWRCESKVAVCEAAEIGPIEGDTSLAGVTPKGPPPPMVGLDWLDLH
ncbi:hypothetical protein Q5P01_016780 [Channa striata]|uniref:Uncharacterized protein n=1 Tax=Channa striata TaxID=64152 RepID=A0AA88M9Y4_CHASR|nr:hypothetical protein Q5P01_016780 [Channa striata]